LFADTVLQAARRQLFRRRRAVLPAYDLRAQQTKGEKYMSEGEGISQL
jgi:hypothetical protein